MTSEVYLEKDGIIHVDSNGPQAENETLQLRKMVLELGKKVPGILKMRSKKRLMEDK
jgi:hypothetical protein